MDGAIDVVALYTRVVISRSRQRVTGDWYVEVNVTLLTQSALDHNNSACPCSHHTLSRILWRSTNTIQFQMTSSNWWNRIGHDISEAVLLYCDCPELMLLRAVNQELRTWLVNDVHVWRSSRLYPESPVLNECTEWVNPTRSSEKACDLAAYVLLHPELKLVGRIDWEYDSIYQNLELRDLAQLFPHVTSLQIECGRYVAKPQIWASMFSPATNQFRLTLHTLKLIRVELCVDDILVLKSAHYPALRRFTLHLNSSSTSPISPRACQNLAQLSNLELLRFDHGFYNVTVPCATIEFYEPLFTMQHLLWFRTNFHMTPEVLHAFEERFTQGHLCFQLAQLDEATPTAHDLTLLETVRECNKRRDHSVVTHMTLDTVHYFEAAMKYLSEMRETVRLEQVSTPETWFVPQLSRWEQLGACSALQHVSIECSVRTRFPIEGVRRLRPLYRQLRTFRLANILATTHDLQLLEAEIAQMPGLMNRDILNGIHWLSAHKRKHAVLNEETGGGQPQ